MLIASAIAAVLGNFYAVLFVVAIVTGTVKARASPGADRWNLFWGELLFYTVGIGFVYAGFFHAYLQQIAAPSIGWMPSPFEYELGWMEIGLGIVAIASLWRGYEFRLATTIVAVVFGFAAAAQHVSQMLCCHNYAPGNAGPLVWIGDLLIPALLAALAILSSRRDVGVV